MREEWPNWEEEEDYTWSMMNEIKDLSELKEGNELILAELCKLK